MAETTAITNCVIQINKGEPKNHLGEVVLNTLEKTLNAMLDAEADECPAAGFPDTSDTCVE